VYIYSIFGREITRYTVIYGVCIRFWPTLNMHAAAIRQQAAATGSARTFAFVWARAAAFVWQKELRLIGQSKCFFFQHVQLHTFGLVQLRLCGKSSCDSLGKASALIQHVQSHSFGLVQLHLCGKSSCDCLDKARAAAFVWHRKTDKGSSPALCDYCPQPKPAVM